MSTKSLSGRKSDGLDRRTFLKTTTATGAALLIGFHLPLRGQDPAEGQEQQPANPFDAWVRITPDNRVALILGKSEMGQGVMTALPMILAEELSVDWREVKVEQAPTNPKIYDHGTGGSGSVAGSWLPLRQAGAAAREMLITAAAQRWNVVADTCKAKDGAVHHGARKQVLSYGELVGDASKLPIPDLHKVPLKNSSDFTIVGHDTRRFEGRGKATGSAKFGLDSRVPGMLYAVVARCPVFGGKVKSFDATKAKAVAGVKDVLTIEGSKESPFTAGGVAVVAENSWAAIEGRKALEVVWEEGPAASESTASLREQFTANAKQPGRVVRNDGDAQAILGNSAKVIEAVYEFPFAAHATMEPMNATVVLESDRAEAWIPTQAPQWAQAVIAKHGNIPPEKVVVHTTLMGGGGFGRRYMGDFVLEAAQVAKATGKPIQLLWTREDDMQHDFYRPASYHHFQGALDGQKNLVAWKHFQTSTSIEAMWGGKEENADRSEFATATFIPYRTPNYRIEYILAKSSVPRAWWRSVEHSTSGFVVESFVDELAHAAGEDSLAFRLRLIGEDRKIPDFTNPKEGKPLDTARLKGVLQLVADKAGWGKPLPAGVSRGIAGYFSFESYTAAVVEASVTGGKLKVHRLVYAVDCGRPVNPNGIRAQVESAAVYGLSATLHDAITIKGGRVEQSNFHDYQMPRIKDAPPTEVHVVMSSEEPTGIGEPGLPVIAPALANAIFAATGKRIRRLPIRPEDLA